MPPQSPSCDPRAGSRPSMWAKGHASAWSDTGKRALQLGSSALRSTDAMMTAASFIDASVAFQVVHPAVAVCCHEDLGRVTNGGGVFRATPVLPTPFALYFGVRKPDFPFSAHVTPFVFRSSVTSSSFR